MKEQRADKLAQIGRILVVLGVILLWLVVGGELDATSILAGIAVAVAVGAWAPLADL